MTHNHTNKEINMIITEFVLAEDNIMSIFSEAGIKGRDK